MRNLRKIQPYSNVYRGSEVTAGPEPITVMLIQAVFKKYTQRQMDENLTVAVFGCLILYSMSLASY